MDLAVLRLFRLATDVVNSVRPSQVADETDFVYSKLKATVANWNDNYENFTEHRYQPSYKNNFRKKISKWPGGCVARFLCDSWASFVVIIIVIIISIAACTALGILVDMGERQSLHRLRILLELIIAMATVRVVFSRCLSQTDYRRHSTLRRQLDMRWANV